MIQQFICIKFIEEQDASGVETCRGSDLQRDPYVFEQYVLALAPPVKVALSTLSILKIANDKRSEAIKIQKRFVLRKAEQMTADNVIRILNLLDISH